MGKKSAALMRVFILILLSLSSFSCGWWENPEDNKPLPDNPAKFGSSKFGQDKFDGR